MIKVLCINGGWFIKPVSLDDFTPLICPHPLMNQYGPRSHYMTQLIIASSG